MLNLLRDMPHGRRLMILDAVFTVLCVLNFAFNVGDALAACWVAYVALLAVLDWRGLSTLGGLIQWRGMRWWLRVGLVFLLVGGYPLALAIYLIRVWRAEAAQARVIQAARPAHIAALERELLSESE